MIFPIKGFTSTEEKPCWYYFRFSYLQIRIQSHLPLLWADLSSDKTDIYAMGKKAWPPQLHPFHTSQRDRGGELLLQTLLLEFSMKEGSVTISLTSYCIPTFPAASPVLAPDTR